MLEFVQQPWHWSVSGFVIAFVLFILLFFGKSFGMSGTMRAVCAAGGAGKKISFFDFDWVNTQGWNLLFALGTVIGGFIASHYLMSPEPVQLSEATTLYLQQLGVTAPGSLEEGRGYIPDELFNFEALLTLKGFLLIVVGGFFVGFGARYAGGCTSGHAISGLSNLQIPSLIAVIGFFIGGLVMTHIFLPFILKM